MAGILIMVVALACGGRGVRVSMCQAVSWHGMATC